MLTQNTKALMKTIVVFITFFFALATAAHCQNIPIYGNLVPSDSGALDIGAASLHWDTIFVDNIYPPVSGSGIWSELNDSLIIWVYGGDTFFVAISDGDIITGQYKNGTFHNYHTFNDNGGLDFSINGNTSYNFTSTTATAAEIRMQEDADNGSNYVSWKSPATLAGNVTLTLPDTDGNANEFLLTDGSGVLSWGASSDLWQSLNDSTIYLEYNTDSLFVGFAGEQIVFLNQTFFDDKLTRFIVSDSSKFIFGTINGTPKMITPDDVMEFYTDDNKPAIQIDQTSTAGQTRFLLYDVDNGTIERVTVGAPDSGGSGFKVLRIPN